jgi:hypothetical protein
MLRLRYSDPAQTSRTGEASHREPYLMRFTKEQDGAKRKSKIAAPIDFVRDCECRLSIVLARRICRKIVS